MPSSDVRRIPIMVKEEKIGSSTSSSSRSAAGSGLNSNPQRHHHHHHQVVQQHQPHHLHRPNTDNSEQYLTTRKVEVKTTKNTEKRVQRQVVLHDGRVIARTEPEIVTDTVEDFTTHEEEHDGRNDVDRSILVDHHNDPIVNDNRKKVGDESFQRTVNTHDVKQNTTQSAMTNNLCGVVKRRDLNRAIREQRPLSDLIIRDHKKGGQVVARKPKVIYSSKSHKKIIDTEDIHNISRMTDDGKVYTETFKTQKHEVINDDESPDNRSSSEDGIKDEFKLKDSQGYKQVKNEKFTDYYHNSQHLGRGGHEALEEKEFTKGKYDWDEMSEQFRKEKLAMNHRLHPGENLNSSERQDALTKRPLNFRKEEKIKKSETGKWLDRHFGSDWSILDQSLDEQILHTRQQQQHHRQQQPQQQQHVGRTHYLLRRTAEMNRPRRSMSFSSIPASFRDEIMDPSKTFHREKTVKTSRMHYPDATSTPIHPNPGQVITRRREEERHYRSHEEEPVVMANNSTSPTSQRKYKSTHCLLPSPVVDYSLHGSSINESFRAPQTPPVRPARSANRTGHKNRPEDALSSTTEHLSKSKEIHQHKQEHHSSDLQSSPQVDQQFYRSHSSFETGGGGENYSVTKRSKSTGIPTEIEFRFKEFFTPDANNNTESPLRHEIEHYTHHRHHHHHRSKSGHRSQRRRQQIQYESEEDPYAPYRSRSVHQHSSPPVNEPKKPVRRSKSGGDQQHETHHHQQQYHHHQQQRHRHHTENASSGSNHPRAVERLNRINDPHFGDQLVYREESKRQRKLIGGGCLLDDPDHGAAQHHHQNQQQHHQYRHRQQHRYNKHSKPRYISEFKEDNLYPAASENNLLFDLNRSSRNYLGFRSLERSDGLYDNNDDSLSTSDDKPHSSLEGGDNHSKRRERRRSQSFVHNPVVNNKSATAVDGSNLDEEYVYSRKERRFIPSFLKHGHSDLRLDRQYKRGGGLDNFEDMNNTPMFDEDRTVKRHEVSDKHYFEDGLKHHEHSVDDYTWKKEVVRGHKKSEPQRFKTIIFLSGGGHRR